MKLEQKKSYTIHFGVSITNLLSKKELTGSKLEGVKGYGTGLNAWLNSDMGSLRICWRFRDIEHFHQYFRRWDQELSPRRDKDRRGFVPFHIGSLCNPRTKSSFCYEMCQLEQNEIAKSTKILSTVTNCNGFKQQWFWKCKFIGSRENSHIMNCIVKVIFKSSIKLQVQ